MTYVPPLYPTTIPSITDLPNRVDDVDWLEAARYNELKKELRAVQTELGTLPKGTYATVKARLDDVAADLGIGITGLENLVVNGNFELWTAGVSVAPDGWASAGAGVQTDREGTEIKIGTYSAKVTWGGSGTSQLYQQLHAEKAIGFWKSRTATLSCWVKTSVGGNAVSIGFSDGMVESNAYHTGGGGYELLTVTKTMASNAVVIQIANKIQDTGVAYFDSNFVVEGSVPFAFSPRALSRGGTITVEVDETKFSHKIPIIIGGTLYYIMLTTS